jgi:ketosteroid isomerase-like protein
MRMMKHACLALALLATACAHDAPPTATQHSGEPTMATVATPAGHSPEETKNLELVAAGFARWKNGTGGVFDLLTPDAQWTIVGNSVVSKKYPSKTAFMDEVILPFNARMSKPLVPEVRGLYADGDMVIALFDASGTVRDGKPYRNTYTWYMKMRDSRIVDVIAFFDTLEFNDFWTRVTPAP